MNKPLNRLEEFELILDYLEVNKNDYNQSSDPYDGIITLNNGQKIIYTTLYKDYKLIEDDVNFDLSTWHYLLKEGREQNAVPFLFVIYNNYVYYTKLKGIGSYHIIFEDTAMKQTFIRIPIDEKKCIKKEKLYK